MSKTVDCIFKLLKVSGGVVVVGILISKLDSDASERVLTNLVNAGKEVAIAYFSNGLFV